MKSRIHNTQLMSQLVDFGDLSVDGYIYPTDIDAVIEYKDEGYIILEIKYGNSKVPHGQRLALQRMVDDFSKIGKKAVVFICEHKTKDYKKPVCAANCRVREMYFGDEHEWRTPKIEITAKEAIRKFKETTMG